MSPWKALVFAKHDAHDALGNTKINRITSMEKMSYE